MTSITRIIAVAVLMLSAVLAFSIDDLNLNPKLDYDSDSQDGPLITGENPTGGAVKGKVNYIIIFEEG